MNKAYFKIPLEIMIFQVGKSSAALFLDCITEILQGKQPDSCRWFI